MTALLVGDSQVAACLLPLKAMRQDAAPTGANLSENMGQFMSQRAIDFGRMLTQLWIQTNSFLTIIGATSTSFQARIPFHANFGRDAIRTVGTQKLARQAQ
jgi:hypothetical protein